MKLPLKEDEVSTGDWYVAWDGTTNHWVVAYNIDTVSNDYETGDPLYGMRSHIDSQYVLEIDAYKRLVEILRKS